MTALSVMRLIPDAGEIVRGSVRLGEEDLLLLPEAAMRNIRGRRISMIFQEPMLSLNPVMTVAAANWRGIAAVISILRGAAAATAHPGNLESGGNTRRSAPHE